MGQMQAFIEKARTDSALMAKLNAPGNGEEASEKVIAIAAEYGFAVTAEDYRQATEMARTQKTGELSEEELEAAAGGGSDGLLTENRYDPVECAKIKQLEYRCVGFLALFCCDHYRRKQVKDGDYYWIDLHTCGMGSFSYKAED